MQVLRSAPTPRSSGWGRCGSGAAGAGAVVGPLDGPLQLGPHLRDAGLVGDGYRLLANTGREAGQEVPHLHVHIFAGRPLGPMLAR